MVTEADWKRWKPEHIRPYMDIALDCFGHERLMIGSDWPVALLRLLIRGRWASCSIISQSIRATSQEAVLGGNAQRFWKLNL